MAKDKKKDKKQGQEEDQDGSLPQDGYSWKAFFPFTEEGKALREEKNKEEEEKEEKELHLERHLRRAGFESVDGLQAKKNIFKVSIVISLLLSAFIIFTGVRSEQTAGNIIIFMLGQWTGLFALILLVVGFFFMLYLDIKAYKRTKEVEAVLPDFLQLASANISAGMPIDRALWFAVRPQFGILASEIEEVAKSTYAGKDLEDALTEFSNRFDSDVLKRAVSLIMEGMGAGGEMADLLNKISVNIEETNILRKEMAANVTTYVIFIGIATLLGAPFLFALATQLLQVIQSIAGSLGGTTTATSSMFAFQINSDAVKLSDFKLYCAAMLVVSSFFSGAIISVIRKGNIKEGAVLIPSFIIATLVLYYLGNLLLGGLMGSFI